MKTFFKRFVIGALVVCLAAFLGGCTANTATYNPSTSSTTVTVGVTAGEYEMVANAAADELSSRGITIETVEYEDAQAALDALAAGEVDSVFCTDTPHVTQYNNENETDLTIKGAITFSKMALYSRTIASVDDVNDGARVAVPSDEAGLSRALYLLDSCGLITLSSDAGLLSATIDDIEENPHSIEFVQTAEAGLAEALSTVDLAAITYSVAYSSGLEFDTALAAEEDDSDASWEYADVVAVRSNEESVDKLDKLVTSMKTQDVQDLLAAEFGNAVIDVFVTSEG